MAEIKSTLELALERTRGMVISEAEKQEIKKKERSQRAMGFFHRYREGTVLLTELLREIDKMEGETAERVKEILLVRWIDAISLGGENEKILRGIEALKGKPVRTAQEKLDRLLAQCQGKKDAFEREQTTKMLENLKKEGIHGDAIVPNIQGSTTWKIFSEALERDFQKKIQEVKEDLKTL